MWPNAILIVHNLSSFGICWQSWRTCPLTVLWYFIMTIQGLVPGKHANVLYCNGTRGCLMQQRYGRYTTLSLMYSRRVQEICHDNIHVAGIWMIRVPHSPDWLTNWKQNSRLGLLQWIYISNLWGCLLFFFTFSVTIFASLLVVN